MALRKASATARVEIPGEPGEWMEFRQLGWHALAEAQKVRRRDAFDAQKEMGKDLFKMMQEIRAEMGDQADQADQAVDVLQSYDLETLLRLGIMAWSYSEPVTEDTIKLLDPQTAEWAGRQIVGERVSEEQRKNSSGSSTEPSSVVELHQRNG